MSVKIGKQSGLRLGTEGDLMLQLIMINPHEYLGALTSLSP